MATTYELRDDADDLPRGPYHSATEAVAAGRRISAKRGYPIQLWRVSETGERFLQEI